MAMVQSKNLKYRKAAAHLFMWVFLAFILFPLLMVVAISFRQGNYSVGDVIPSPETSTLDHWKLALGISVHDNVRVRGADIRFLKTDDGKAVLFAADNGTDPFDPFVTAPFDVAQAKAATSKQMLSVKATHPEAEPDESQFLDDAKTLDLTKAVAGKLAIDVAKDDGSSERYMIEPNDKDGTSFGVYRDQVTPPPFPVMHWLWNSIKVAFITAALIICLATTSAYAFARMRFRGRTFILNSMLIFQMFPAVLALVAIYALFNRIGSYIPALGLNSHGGLILSYLGGVALHIWTIKGYFETIDPSLEQAAAIDGATPWQAFRLILLPLSVPILAVVFILAFISTITEVPVASVLLMDMDKLTLAVGSQQYLYPQNYLWGDFAAAAVLSGLPITIVFLLAQRWLVGGLTAGGVKG